MTSISDKSSSVGEVEETFLGTFLKLPYGVESFDGWVFSDWRRRNFYKKGSELIWKNPLTGRIKGILDLKNMNIDTLTTRPTNWSKNLWKITSGYGFVTHHLTISEINKGDFNHNLYNQLNNMTNMTKLDGGKKMKKNRKSKKMKKFRKYHKSKKIRKTNRRRKFSRKLKY